MNAVPRIDHTNVGFYMTPPPGHAKGLIPRDFKSFPVGSMRAAPKFDNSKLIPENDFPDLIRQQEADQSSLEHLARAFMIDALDQDGQGFCWAYSTTYAVMMDRLRQGLPVKRLSGHMLGCLIKGYRDEGGWNGESLQKTEQIGVASVDTWKEKSMSRSNDTQAMRDDAALNIVTEWDDLSDDPDEAKHQLATKLILNEATMIDLNWWGHSVCAVRLISWNPFIVRIRNSWTNTWGHEGYGDLQGSHAIPNGAAGPRVTVLAA